MNDFLDRLKKEKEELSEKIERLSDFIESEAFAKIEPTQMTLLNIQIKAMQTYGQCLLERIVRLEVESKSDKILMGRDNPNGRKLEDLLGELSLEVQAKSEQIKDSKHPQRDMIINHNHDIINLINDARDIQINTYEQLDAVEPNKGALNPRL